MLAVLYILSVAGLLWTVLTEGTYLNPQLTQYFYRRGAANYEQKWKGVRYNNELADNLFLSSIQRLATRQEKLRVLDACCGTGRVAKMLLRTDWFRGSILAFDASPDMLQQFKAWSRVNRSVDVEIRIDHASMHEYSIETLPSLDVISWLECSELLPGGPRAIQRFAEKLRPGGLLLMTKVPDWLAPLFPGRCQQSAELRQYLVKLGFRDVTIVNWRWRYRVVTAWKI